MRPTGQVLLVLAAALVPSLAFLPPLAPSSALCTRIGAVGTIAPSWSWSGRRGLVRRSMAEEESQDDEDEVTPPGKMKVSEIKAELDLRGVSYGGVFERSELEKLLREAREDGVARPELIDAFNAGREEEQKTQRKKIEDFDWEAAKANDGTLPGGLAGEAVQKLASNEELMTIMQDPNLQELMKATMEKDTAKMGQLMQDPKVMELIQRFNQLAQEAGIDPSMLQ